METLMQRYGISDSWAEVKPECDFVRLRVGRDLIAKLIARDVCGGIQPDLRLLNAFMTYEEIIKIKTSE